MNIIRALLVVLGCLALGEAAVWILGFVDYRRPAGHYLPVCLVACHSDRAGRFDRCAAHDSTRY